jgi:NAD(P)H-hydrate epimerase
MSKSFSISDVPDLTTKQMVEVDREMIEDYRIELIQMMENAGRNLAHLTRTRFLDGDPRGRPVVVLAGGGGRRRGAGRCPAAVETGSNVTVLLGQAAPKMTPVPGHQHDILDRMGVRIVPDAIPSAAPPPAVVLDGLIGYSLVKAPFGRIAELICRRYQRPAWALRARAAWSSRRADIRARRHRPDRLSRPAFTRSKRRPRS